MPALGPYDLRSSFQEILDIELVILTSCISFAQA
jgi:hypothetical protein